MIWNSFSLSEITLRVSDIALNYWKFVTVENNLKSVWENLTNIWNNSKLSDIVLMSEITLRVSENALSNLE